MKPTSLSVEELVEQCAKGTDPAAWVEFIHRFHRLIASVVIRSCREWSETSSDVVEDLIQETYLKLCANHFSLLTKFRSQHANAIFGYIKVVTANVVYDYFRAQHASKRNVEKNVALSEATDAARPEQGRVPQAVENTVLLNEIDSLLLKRGSGDQESKERTVFWLYYRQGFTARAIASIPSLNLTVKGVESTIFRVTTFIRRSLAEQPEKITGCTAEIRTAKTF